MAVYLGAVLTGVPGSGPLSQVAHALWRKHHNPSSSIPRKQWLPGFRFHFYVTLSYYLQTRPSTKQALLPRCARTRKGGANMLGKLEARK